MFLLLMLIGHIVAEALEPFGEIQTELAMFDNEKAAFKSFKKHFSPVTVKICSFHAKQGLNRKVYFASYLSLTTYHYRCKKLA